MYESRVIAKNPASGMVNQSLGSNVAEISSCTDEQVRSLSIKAKEYQAQLVRSRIYKEQQGKIWEVQKQIEKLALELLEAGMATDEHINDCIAKGIEGGVKYKSAIELRRLQAQLKVRETEAKFNADSGLASAKNAGAIGLISARYGIDLQFLQQGYQLQQSRLSPMARALAQKKNEETIERQEKEQYLRAEDVGNKRNSQRGGLLQTVTNWFKI